MLQIFQFGDPAQTALKYSRMGFKKIQLHNHQPRSIELIQSPAARYDRIFVYIMKHLRNFKSISYRAFNFLREFTFVIKLSSKLCKFYSAPNFPRLAFSHDATFIYFIFYCGRVTGT